MTPRLSEILIGVALVIGSLALVVFGVDSCHRKQGTAQELIANEAKGEASTHADTAAKVPDHARELQSAQDDVARARAEVERVSKLLVAYQRHAVPDPAGPSSPVLAPVDPDPRNSVIDAQGVLIEKLDGQVHELQLALTDEQKRASEFKAAFEAERRRAQAQELATEAWKQAVSTSKWRGRIEGFAAGVALGYVGARR